MEEHAEMVRRIRSRILERIDAALDQPKLSIGNIKTNVAILEDIADLAPGTEFEALGPGYRVHFLGDADEFSR